MHSVVFSEEIRFLSRQDSMNMQMKELQQLNGTREVLSQRLIESSYDTIAKVAAADEKGWRELPA